jgi:hypothetical protein
VTLLAAAAFYVTIEPSIGQTILRNAFYMTTQMQQEQSPPSPVGQERQPVVVDFGCATLMIELVADEDEISLPGMLTVSDMNRSG